MRLLSTSHIFTGIILPEIGEIKFPIVSNGLLRFHFNYELYRNQTELNVLNIALNGSDVYNKVTQISSKQNVDRPQIFNGLPNTFLSTGLSALEIFFKIGY